MLRRSINSATYSISVNTTSNWSAAKYCRGEAYEESQGSYINCGGTAYVDFTADGSHNLLGINSNTSSEQTVDLTSKGCTCQCGYII